MYRAIRALQNDLIQGKTTSTAVLGQYLEAIEKNKHLNAYIEVFEEDAMRQASAIDDKITAGLALGKLFGVVIGIKDVISYKGHQLSASSKILQGYEAIYNATAIERLLAEDAIIVGRLGCDEFAMGSSNENSYYGPVLNPVDESRVPGGSSGASATAVKAGLCTVSLGSDTGGSVRQPASFCGVIGLKPSYGRVSRYGLIAYGSSFDQIGPIGNNIDDVALVLEVMAGEDEFDSTVSTEPVAPYSRKLDTQKKYKIGYYEEAINHPSIDDDVRRVCQDTLDLLRKEGHTVEPIHIKELDYIVPAYYVLTTAEASSNLGRYDGIRYGYKSQNAHDLDSSYKKTRSEGFGIEVKRRIMSGTFVLSSGYYDAYYSKAQKVRRIIADETYEALDQYDFIMCPTTPSPAYKIGEMTDDPIAMYLGDIFTVQANLTGIPAISLPLGASTEGLPIGMQFMAGKFREESLLAFSHSIMEAVV
ncbi:MAG: Asp-tRNA(Asn)/Glu-tRNA(Gln) amidotransferase subunit GatA [Bacteroidetes bacterium]|nr:Asp-tRNA(Asn)/Glu-tRNA(Gln) amidotransferase subunit GatA [Bacteroidota bacterium]